MIKARTENGGKNLIGNRLKKLRELHHLSQQDLAHKLQLAGYDMNKNVITRIETSSRYVTDFELKALTEIFAVTYEYLIEGKGEHIVRYSPARSFSLVLCPQKGIPSVFSFLQNFQSLELRLIIWRHPDFFCSHTCE